MARFVNNPLCLEIISSFTTPQDSAAFLYLTPGLLAIHRLKNHISAIDVPAFGKRHVFLAPKVQVKTPVRRLHLLDRHIMNIRLLEQRGQVLIDVEDLFAFGYKLVMVVTQLELVAGQEGGVARILVESAF